VKVTVVAAAGDGNILLAVQAMVVLALLPHLLQTPAATRRNCFATCAPTTLVGQTSVAVFVPQAALQAQSSYRQVVVLRLFEEQRAPHVPAAVGDAVSAQHATFGVLGMQAPASPCLPAKVSLLCVGPVGSVAFAAKGTGPQAAALMIHWATARTTLGVSTPKSLQVIPSSRHAQMVGAAACRLHAAAAAPAAAVPEVPLVLLLPAKLPFQMGARGGK